MGKIYNAPKAVGQPPAIDFNNVNTYDNACEEWLKKLENYCIQNGEGKFRGKQINFPVADNYARYMVFSTKPVQLIHIDIWDGYQYPYAHRLTAKDIKEEVERAELFAEK